MLKIRKADRKFFLKWLPYNFCDRFCERCSEVKDGCYLNTENVRFQLECLHKCKDPHDPKVVFEHIEKVMRRAFKNFKDSLKKEGIEIYALDENMLSPKGKKQKMRLASNILHKGCARISRNLQNFLDEFNPATLAEPLPWVADFWRNELEELFYYGPIIAAKADQALQLWWSKGKRSKYGRPEYLVSASIAYYSLLTVERSLLRIKELVRNQEPIWTLKINKLVLDLDASKRCLQKKFPQVKLYRNKIIFHGRYDGALSCQKAD